MSEPLLERLGDWSGTSQLWLYPGADAEASQTAARVSPVAQGQFIAIAYTWEYGDEPQEGMILFGSRMGATPTRAVWLDSWHMRDDIMVCDSTQDGGVVSLRGSYAAPRGPDWGWRIEIEMERSSSLVVRMFNVTPLGEEALAVLAWYERDAR
jgi:hypothetical protein